MTKMEKILLKILLLILVWLFVTASAIALPRLVDEPSSQQEEDTIYLVVAEERCWVTFDVPRTEFQETTWTTREGGQMVIVGDVFYLEVVDGNMNKAYMQLGFSEEECLNL